MQIVTVVGARPQFIKAAALSRAIQRRGGIDESLVHTGQHYDANLSQVFFDELAIPAPRYHLEIGSGPQGWQTGRMLEALERVLLEVRPRGVVVFGDTNSTLAASLAATKLHIPLAHVEAGVRSFNRQMPEEINRVVTDQLAELLLTPSAAADAHLGREGIPAERIHRVGDVMADVAERFAEQAAARSTILARHALTPGAYVLATVHRAENTDNPARLAGVFRALAQLAQQRPVVVPLHPRTRRALDALAPGAWSAPSGLHLIEPVGYLDMTQLERHARLIVTDSGGVQREAFFHRVPCVVLRRETEWPELVEAGHRLLPPHDDPSWSAELLALAEQPPTVVPTTSIEHDGRAAERIVDVLLEQWSPT